MSNELQLDEFEIINKYHDEDGNLCYDIAPIKNPECCPKCLHEVFVKNGTIDRMIKDLPSFGNDVYLIIKGNRFKCLGCGKTFVQSFDSIDDHAKITKRLEQKIQELSLERTIQELTVDYNLAKSTIYRISEKHVDELNSKRVPYSPRVLGIDEAHLNKETRGVFVDIEKHGIIEILPTRAKQSVIDYLDSLPNNEKIEIVTMDMWKSYKEAVYECLPHAKVVIDRFHVVKILNVILDGERKAIIKKLPREERPNMKKSKRVLLERLSNLDEDDLEELNKIFNKFPLLQDLYTQKEAFANIYEAKDRESAENAYKEFLSNIPKRILPTLSPFLKTVENWHTEIFNYFDHKYTNGVVESLNNSIKSIERIGRGYSFKMLRARIIFGTPAYKKAAYKVTKKKPVYRPSDGLMSYLDVSTLLGGGEVKTLEHGDYVDFEELVTYLNSKQ